MLWGQEMSEGLTYLLERGLQNEERGNAQVTIYFLITAIVNIDI